MPSTDTMTVRVAPFEDVEPRLGWTQYEIASDVAQAGAAGKPLHVAFIERDGQVAAYQVLADVDKDCPTLITAEVHPAFRGQGLFAKVIGYLQKEHYRLQCGFWCPQVKGSLMNLGFAYQTDAQGKQSLVWKG